jgi:hypothetical protein
MKLAGSMRVPVSTRRQLDGKTPWEVRETTSRPSAKLLWHQLLVAKDKARQIDIRVIRAVLCASTCAQSRHQNAFVSIGEGR